MKSENLCILIYRNTFQACLKITLHHFDFEKSLQHIRQALPNNPVSLPPLHFFLFATLHLPLLIVQSKSQVLSAAERRGTPVLLSASVSDNFDNSPQIAAPRRSREIDQSTQRFYVGWFHVGWQGIGDQSDAVTQNAWFRCALCAAISGEISILIQTGAESWGRFPVPRICRWESKSQVEIVLCFKSKIMMMLTYFDPRTCLTIF